MSKASNRSAEYFFTGVYNGDDNNNDIDAIGLGGVIYARGGDDDIFVGSIAAKVEAGSGDDTIKGGAAYLEVLDTTGKLTVKGAAGAMNIIKEGDGDIDATVVAGANIINHTGNSGSMNVFAIGAYNKITRKSTGYGANGKLALDDIVLGDARFENETLGISTDKVSAVKKEGYYLYEHWYYHDGYYSKAFTKLYLFQDEKTGDIKTKKTTTIFSFDSISNRWRRTSGNGSNFNDLVDINYNVKATKIKSEYSSELPKEWLGGDSILLKYEDELVLKKDNLTLNAIKLSDGNSLSAIKSTGKPGAYYFVSRNYIYEIVISDAYTRVNIDGETILTPCQGMKIIPYKRSVSKGMVARPNDTINKIPDGLVERTGSGYIGRYRRVVNIANVPSIDSISYSINKEVMVDKKLNRLEPNKVSNITNMNLINSSDDINFEGGGIANVIESDVVRGNVTFKGGGAANIITHTAVKGNTDFTGGGIANIIVKSGGEGNLTFNGAGLANVLVHKSQKGDMKVNAGGAVNVMVRLGNGQYDVTLIALGNISVHSGDGNSIVKMLGGLNTHTQIGDGEAFWIAAGGLNVLTKKGQGSLFSVVGGGGNVITSMGQGDLTIVALGLGNIITHISDDENHARTTVIAVAAANIVTKKGRGDMRAILAGGLNVLTHVGGGKTDTIMLGGGNILTKVGNGSANGIMFGLGNIFTHVGDGQTLGVMAGGGNIYTKVGDGTTIAAMLAAGNIMTHIGDGNTYVLMAALGNVITKVGDGDLLALMIAKGNILTQVGNGQTFALMLAKGGNILTKVGDGMTLAAMISIANVMTHVGHGETFALMIGKANIFTKVGSGLTVAVMVGNINVYSQINNHKNESIGIGVFIGKLNVMTKVGDGTALAIMVGKANIMTHIGNGITGGIALAKGNIITKVGDGFMGILAKADGNVITHVGTGITAVVLHGKGNILTKVGNDTTIGLLISQTGNIMTHIGNGMTIGIAKGKGNIITKIGNGTGINAVWGELNVITQVGDGDRYNFVKGKGNVITRVGNGQEVTVTKGDANIVSAIGDIDNYTFAWGKQNIITAVGSGRNVVVAKANNNIVTKVGDGDAYNVLWANNNIVTTVGDGNAITIAKGKINVTTDVGDGLNVTVVYGDTNINTKVGDGTSVNVAWGKYNINTKVGDGLNVAVMKGKANANINVGDGLSVVATYGRNNVSVKVGNGDYYNLSVASSNTRSNKLSTLFGNIKQNLLGRAGSQGIDYLVNGNEGQTTGFRNGHGGFNLPEVNNLNGFNLNETGVSGKFDSESAPSDFSAKINNINNIDAPNLESTKNNASKALGGSDNTSIKDDVQHSKTHFEIEEKVGGDKARAEDDAEQFQRYKDKQTENASVIQSQIEGTDKAALAATAADYQQQMEQQANELLTEKQKIAQSINNISADENTETGEDYRQQFAGGLLKDINEKLDESIKTANESLDTSQSNVNKHQSAMNDAVAQSESALAKGDQDKNKADAAKVTAELEVAKRKTEAQQQKIKANEANRKAQEDVVIAKSRGEGHLKEANNEADAAAREAKSVKRSEGDAPKNRREAEGSGLNQSQKAYHTDVKEVSDASISPDESFIPDRQPLAPADGRITNIISDVSSVEDLTTGQSKIKEVKILSNKLREDNFGYNVLDIVKKRGRKNSSVEIELNVIISKDELKKQASVMGKPIGYSYKKILNIIDLINSTSNSERIKNIFILKSEIERYISDHPTSGRNKAFLTLGEKIDKSLFNSKMQPAKNAILRLTKTQPEIAARLYEVAVRESQGSHVGLTNMMHIWISEDGYLTLLKGFEGIIPDRNLLNFNPTYHIAMGDQFDECKTKLLQAQSNGELRQVYINESTRSFTIGYTYEEMASFRARGSENSQFFSYILNEVAGRNNSTDRSKELNWLDNCADKKFLKQLQLSRLDQIESIYQRNNKIDFASWDSKYSGISRDRINRELNQYGDVDGQLSVLLRGNQGLLIGETHGSQEEGRRFIIEQISELKRHGVTTIGLEHLRRDHIQPLIDDYYRTGVISPDLNTFLTAKGVKNIVTTAFENKVKIIFLDDNSTSKGSGNHSLMYRAGSANNIAVDILKQIPANEKFVVIYGEAHLKSHIGIESPVSGISHQMKLPILQVDANNRLTVSADDPTQRTIYPRNNTTGSPRIIFPATLNDTSTKRNTRQSVDNWEVATVKSSSSWSFSQYNGQIIVQLENDPIAAEAAANLAAKHPGSILVQLDSNGQYRVVSGDPTSLHGNIRWQLVGHGRDGSNGQDNQTLSNENPTELATRIRRFKDELDNDYHIKSTPNYISLVGCSLVDKNRQQGFARQFITELGNQGIKTDVAARNTRVLVNEQGRKNTLDDDGNLKHKVGSDKVILRLNNEGQVENITEKVRNNIHVSEIDIHRVGAKDIDSPASGAIGRNTEEFSPPEKKQNIDKGESSTDKKQGVSYAGNINIQIGDDEFTSINWGTSNLGIKVGHGGFKTLVFGDNNIMIHIGDGMSKHSVNIGGYQAFEGVQAFMGSRNISFNYGHSNDLIFMTEKTVLSPPLVNPFDGATRICVALENIATEGYGGDWLQAQAQQWTFSGAKQYLNELSALDSTSNVEYNSLIEIDSQLIRSARGLKSDINATLNKKYNQWLGKPSTTENNHQVKTTKADKLRKLNDTMVFNIAVGGQGADIIVTNSNWNFTFGDNIQSIMDINLGSLFAISTQQVTRSGRVKTTMTYSIDDMPRQIKNQLINKLSLIESDMTLGDVFGVDYDAAGNIVSRTGEDIDGEKILKEMIEVVAEFGGEKLNALSDPQKLLNGLKANLNMGENAITSFAQTHGLQDKAPNEGDETAAVNASGSRTTQPPENKDQAFGFSSLNLPNLFATLFNKDKQTEMADRVNNLKQNMAQDLLNMEEKTFDFLRNSGFLRGDGDLNWSLGNYNFTLGGHGNDLGAYLGDNNNFWGGQGDDAFYGMGISNVFTGGQGDDTGVLMGRENTMFGGAGDDTAVLAGRINHANLGAGNDKAFIFGETGTVNMGDGDDYAVVAGHYNRTDGEQGQDYVVLMGNNNVAELGEGNDYGVVFGNENSVSGNQGSDTIKLMGYSSVIMGGDGNDHLIADVISKFSDFLGGEGDDMFELGGYQNKFSGLDGVDSFVVSTAVIDCTVTDISREDKILMNNVSWRDLWLQRSGYDLTILVRRPIADDSAQGDFERVGSVTFNDYFNGKRAAIVVSDKGVNGSPHGYEVLTDSAIDGLVQNMNNFPVSDGKSSFIGQMDTQIQQKIAGLWANTTLCAA